MFEAHQTVFVRSRLKITTAEPLTDESSIKRDVGIDHKYAKDLLSQETIQTMCTSEKKETIAEEYYGSLKVEKQKAQSNLNKNNIASKKFNWLISYLY